MSASNLPSQPIKVRGLRTTWISGRLIRMGNRQLAGSLIVAALAVVLLTFNLASYPQPWFDEGYYASVAKMLGTQGLYALPDSSGPRVMDRSVGTGPVVIVPIALAFRLAGVGFLQARIIAVALALLALLAYGLLARRMVGHTATLGALVLLLAGTPEPFTSFVMLGRQVLGEVTALGLALIGIWLWLRSSDQRRWRWTCAAGLAFGLATLSKPQIFIALAPMLVLMALADRLYYHQSHWSHFVVPGLLMAGCTLTWSGLQDVLRPDSGAMMVETLRTNILTFDLIHMRHALGALWRSGFGLWGLPGLIYAAWLARRRDHDGLAHAMVLALALFALGWFVILSIGWARYAFVPLALAPIWSARLAYDLIRRLSWRWRIALGVAIMLVLAFNSRLLLAGIFGPQETSAADLSAYLRDHIPADTLIESWEWNLDITAPQRFHHPPSSLMLLAIDTIQREQVLPPGLYDPAVGQPAYIVDGPFSSWTRIYHEYIGAHCERVVQFGTYALYKVVK